MTNRPENFCNAGVLHLGVSDYSLICGCRKIAFSRNPSKLVEHRCLKNYKSSAFKTDLNECLIMSDWTTNDPNALWNQFRDAFNYVADVHSPIKTRRSRSIYTPWLNKNINTEMNYRDYLKKRAVKTSHQRDYEASKKQRNRVNKLVKVKYYHDVINNDQSNPKAMWKHINQLVHKRAKTTQMQHIKVNDSVLSKIEDIADAFNTYFV